MKNDSGAVAAVKARANIAEIVGRYVTLRPVGSRLVGPCPFHQETKGSFNVHPDKGFFHCFGCQASGDVIDFFCRINGLEFREGLERLAAEVGVDLGRARSDPRAAAKKRERDACLAMHELADRYFRHLLGQSEGRIAREYLERRGVSAEMIERFSLGVSPEGWQGLQTVLRGRGEGDPKYLNSAETPIYTKGQHLYGLYEARPVMAKTRRALLSEGYLDVITLHQFGYGEACGVLGTAMTHEQAKRLSGFAPRVDLVFDGDAPGRKAAVRAAQMLLTLGGACRVVPLPDGEDVDSLLHAQGRDGFEACLERAEDGLNFCLRMVRESYAPREIVAWAGEFLGGLADEGLRALFIPRVASGLGLAEAELRRLLSRPAKRPAPGPRPGEAAAPRQPVWELAPRDAQILSFVVRRPDYAAHLAGEGVAELLGNADARMFFARLAGLISDESEARLTEPETAFWAKAQMEPPVSDADAAAFFEELCVFLHEARESDRRRAVMDAIRLAQQRGDSEEALRLLGELQALSGRGDE